MVFSIEAGYHIEPGFSLFQMLAKSQVVLSTFGLSTSNMQ